jgi:hypothetical protein
MAPAMNLCVWHVNIYIYFCVVALSKTAKLQEKKMVHLYAEGKAVGVGGAVCPNGRAYAEGKAVGV